MGYIVKADNDAARRVVSHGFLPRPWYAHGGGGRGNLRVAKTPPLQSALRGCHCARIANHPRILQVDAIINGKGVKADNDATRRVATSSEKRENRV